MLTHRQKNVLDFIQSEQREKGITPSTREIQKHFRFASQTSVMQYIAALERKGFLSRHARKARALITPMQKVRITDVPIYGEIPDPPDLTEKWKLILRHCQLVIRQRGAEESAIRSMRARLMAYSRAMPDAKRLREKFSHVSTLAEVETIAEENIFNSEDRINEEGKIPALIGF